MQTNGANTGVGLQIAKAFADNGYTVYVGSRDLQKGETAVSEIGGNAKLFSSILQIRFLLMQQ